MKTIVLVLWIVLGFMVGAWVCYCGIWYHGLRKQVARDRQVEEEARNRSMDKEESSFSTDLLSEMSDDFT